MTQIQPLYTVENCRVAYRLYWAVCLFADEALPSVESWLSPLRAATEGDGVRILEARISKTTIAMFLVSSIPNVSPSSILRSLKGRLQYQIRELFPKAFRRNYRIDSIGEATVDALAHYVERQAEHRAVAVELRTWLDDLQLQNPDVDLNRFRASSYGQFIHNLHLVIERHAGDHETQRVAFETSRDMLRKLCEKHGYLLSRAGFVTNHMHVLLGCPVDESPQEVALRVLNNLAFAHGMQAVFRTSYFVGTFGPQSLQSLRHAYRKPP